MQRNLTILFHCTDSTLYQLVSCYLNLQGLRIVASMKQKDVLQKIDRQKFSAMILGSESEVFLDEFMYATSQKDNMNFGVPVVLMNDPRQNIQVESNFTPSIKGIVNIPFTLSDIHKSLIVAIASAKK
ncbi:MAG: hypothetical protein KF767_13600 [Bdellovibrionaceae bacterium]|nr:hypothetical protein [Pseudobdellovibrionaceae bacterium]